MATWWYRKRDWEFGHKARLELYSIEVESIHEERVDGFQIQFYSPNNKECLYNRVNEGETVPTGVPLTLSGPIRPTQAYDPAWLVSGDPNWDWLVSMDRNSAQQLNQPLQHFVYDRETDSCVTVNYEIIPHSVEAHLQFIYGGHSGQDIHITGGTISTSTDEMDGTERVLRSFDPSMVNNRGKRRQNDVILKPGEEIPLDRRILGLPLKSELVVVVNLFCRLLPAPPKELKTQDDEINSDSAMEETHEDEMRITQTMTFKVPESPRTDQLVTDHGGLGLTFRVSWEDEYL